MCAWWAGQPVYGSNAVSKYVRENLEYLKTYTDLLANAGVSLADLQTLAGVTANAGEINILDGATLTTAELNALAGSGITLADLQKLHAVTSNSSELNLLDGCTASYANLNRTKFYPIMGNVVITSATDTTISGLGFTPRMIVFMCGGGANISLGFDNGTTHYIMSLIPGTGGISVTSGYSIYGYSSLGNSIVAYVSSVNTNGFVIRSTETGIGTAYIFYIAFP